MLREIVKKTIEAGMIMPGERVLAAVSGGPDSMCMLHVLIELSQVIGFELYCAHVNHLLRGEESDADEELVRSFASENNISFTVRRIDVAAAAVQNRQSVEDVARRLRYAFLFEASQAVEAQKIAVAHNKNDQAETLLMRFIRGSGASGLSGIAWERKDGVIRPIMGCTREQVEKYCADNKVPFRIDRSNACTKYTRNRIRHELLPILRKDYNPAIVNALAKTADILQVEDEFWQIRISEMYKDLACINNGSAWEFDIKDSWIALALAEKRRWIRYVCNLCYKEPKVSFEHIRAIVELADGCTGKRIDLPDGLLVLKNYDRMIFTCRQEDDDMIQIIKPQPDWPKNGKLLSADSMLELEHGTITAKIVGADDFSDTIEEYSRNRAVMDYDAVTGDMYVRFRMSGDRFRPLGLSGSVKLKDFFINKKIQETQRKTCPLVCDTNGIIWVAGSIIADGVRISGKTSRYLLLEYHSN